MIDRAILARPESTSKNFDYFNDYKDTMYWLSGLPETAERSAAIRALWERCRVDAPRIWAAYPVDEALLKPVLAGKIWLGTLEVRKKPTRVFSLERIREHVQEAIYYDFHGDHPQVADDFDMTVDDVGVSLDDDTGESVSTFPVKVVSYDPDATLESVAAKATGFVRERIADWYDGMRAFNVITSLEDQNGEHD